MLPVGKHMNRYLLSIMSVLILIVPTLNGVIVLGDGEIDENKKISHSASLIASDFLNWPFLFSSKVAWSNIELIAAMRWL